MEFVRALNRYWDEQQPWQTIKSDRERTGTVCYVALRAIDTLKIALVPFLPFTCERLHHMLGYDGQLVGEFEVREIRETERAHFALAAQPIARRSTPSPHRPTLRQTGGKNRRRRAGEVGQTNGGVRAI
jgi:methionyl-tRNA synthetase